MEMIVDVIEDAVLDSVRMLPFLFAAFLLIEALERYSGDLTERIMRRVGKAGPILGALLGCIPQCGFSVLAANLYAGGVISVGTLLSVFLSTSDEAVILLLGSPGYLPDVGALLLIKVVIATLTGYLVDFFLAGKITVPKESGVLCKDLGCQEEKGILKPALNHTVRIFVYLFLFTAVLNFCIELFGISRLSAFLLGDFWFQPAVAAVIGLIPNCAASVILTELYISGALTFASLVAGLLSSAGFGLVILFRENRQRKENLEILGILFLTAVVSGLVIGAAGIKL